MNERERVGIIYYGNNLGEEEKSMFVEVGERNNIEFIPINVSKKITEEEIKEKILQCELVYNNTAEDSGVEVAKIAESLGKKVIDSPESTFVDENKWLFYLKCKENKVPTPETTLLSLDLNEAKTQLEEFGRWPVILKRVFGTMGEYVEMAQNIEEAEKVINHFWTKGNERMPVIAQEFVQSPSYRVTVIGDKIVQTAIKKNKSSWKATGVYAKKFEKFDVEEDLKQILLKVKEFSNIHICGVDLLRKDGKWFVLEINSEPDLNFFEDERKTLVEIVVNLLKDNCVEKKENNS